MKEIIREHISHKNQIIKLSQYELIKTYRGAVLGWAWAIIKPMMMIFTYWFTFAVGLRMNKDMFGFPYFLWLIAGIIPWFYIDEMLKSTSGSMIKYNYLINKISFPISTIPTFVSLSKMYIHLILMFLTCIIFCVFKCKIDIYLLQLPFYIFMMFLFFTILSLITSILSVISKDFYNLLKSITHMLFWFSGVIWDISSLNVPILRKILYFNPITYIVNGYRNCFIKKVWFFEEPVQLIIFCVLLILISVFTVWLYNKNKKEILDII